MFERIRIFLFGIVIVSLVSCSMMHEVSESSASMQQPAWTESPEETLMRIGSGDPVAGKNKAELCFGCHGEDGNSTDPEYPKLAGQYAAYISKQVRNYLAGRLNHQIMGSIAITISDNDIDDISAYFASQPMMQGDRPSGNKLGKKLYENDDMSRMMVRCSNCHGIRGKGLAPDNPVDPVIGGQHKEYLLTQLLRFRQGARNNSPGGIMNTIVHHLSDAEIEALAEYTAGL